MSRRMDGEIRVGWRMAGLGFEVGAQVAAGALLGWGFDRWRGTDPNGLLIGSVLGILIGLWNLVRGSLKLNAQLERTHPTKGIKPLPPDDPDEDNPGMDD